MRLDSFADAALGITVLMPSPVKPPTMPTTSSVGRYHLRAHTRVSIRYEASGAHAQKASGRAVAMQAHTRIGGLSIMLRPCTLMLTRGSDQLCCRHASPCEHRSLINLLRNLLKPN
eukprot:290512-Chlamydomonas_euryale.AAC.1